MGHTCTKLMYHCVFGTKARKRMITDQLSKRPFPYIKGILRHLGGDLIAGGGTEDHIHLLIELRPDTSVAEAMRVVKANSSKWIHETFASRRPSSGKPAMELSPRASLALARSSGTLRARSGIINDNRSRRNIGFCSSGTK